MEPNNQGRFHLENIVRFVRPMKAPVNRNTLLRNSVVTATGLNGASRFIRRADQIPQSQPRVDCISINAKTVGPNQVYDCRDAQCPLLDQDGKCIAGQEIRTRKQGDDRVLGASQRQLYYGQASRKPSAC